METGESGPHFTAPSVVCCKNDPARRALQFKNKDDARQYHASLLRNGTDALLCIEPDHPGACVCEVRQLSDDELAAWMAESKV